MKKIVMMLMLAMLCCIGTGSIVQAAGETKETAIDVALDTPVSGTMRGEENEAYWYKFTVPNDGSNRWYTFTCNNYADDALSFDVYNGKGEQIGSELVVENTTDSYTCKIIDSGSCVGMDYVSPGEVIYLKVTHYHNLYLSRANGGYSVQVSSQTDDNWGTINASGEVKIGQIVTGKLERVGDQDYYSFTLPSDGKKYKLTVSVDGYNNARLLDYTGTEIYYPFSKSWTYTFSGDGKKYYVIFARKNNDTAVSYQLGVSVEKQKISKLKIGAKKNAKKVTISTIKGAKVKVSFNKKIIKNGKKKVRTITKTTSSGKLTLKLSKKLMKKCKITVVVSKDGYITMKKQVKIK